jgi:hypothetical protein
MPDYLFESVSLVNENRLECITNTIVYNSHDVATAIWNVVCKLSVTDRVLTENKHRTNIESSPTCDKYCCFIWLFKQYYNIMHHIYNSNSSVFCSTCKTKEVLCSTKSLRCDSYSVVSSFPINRGACDGILILL